jgi:hypothetical protein
MKNLNNALDKSAITLSTLCLVHCLALPLVTVILPSMIATAVNQEFFHSLMVICVLPISIYALTMGCKKHNKLSVALYGGLGLACLVAAVLFGESHLGEVGEKLITTIGSLMIAFAHIQNYKLCLKSDSCSC